MLANFPDNKLCAMVLNGAIGDQYGSPIEMMPSEVILDRYGKYVEDYIITEKIEHREYTYTDDTQMIMTYACSMNSQE